MLTRYLLKLCTSLLIAGATANAAASTPITFEDSPTFLTAPGGAAYSLAGLNFLGSSYFGVQSGLFITNNPSKYLVYFAGGSNTLTLQRSNKGLFDLDGFSFGPSENVTHPDVITLTGYLSNGDTYTKTLSFAQAASQTYIKEELHGFVNLTKLVFGSLTTGSNAGYAWVDNISVSPVPEANAMLMLLAGLGVISFMRKREA